MREEPISPTAPIRWLKAVRQLRQRNAATAWWVTHQTAHPLGIVSMPVAAVILGVRTCRVHALVREGRLRVIEGMPGSKPHHRFVPVEDLLSAPFRANAGRPGLYGGNKGPRKRAMTIVEKNNLAALMSSAKRNRGRPRKSQGVPYPAVAQ